MLKSMTGYGRGQLLIDGRDITVEIRSVNHRFFEFSARMPRAYGYLEEKLKSYLQGKIARGKVEVGVTIQALEVANTQVEINGELANSYLQALRGLGEQTGLVDDLTLSTMTRFSDLFVVRKLQEDEQVIWAAVQQVTDLALERFVAMRTLEGQRLQQDLTEKLAVIGQYVQQVQQRSPQTVAEYRQRLYTKLQEVLSDTQVDEQRILTEAAIFAEKTAVDEETVRLRSHIDQFAQIMQSDQPVGRKLDFLIQEFNREANTIGSKAQDLAIARIVVEIKSEIEKIREQIQNIE